MKKPTVKNMKDFIKKYEEKKAATVTAEIETDGGTFTLEVKRELSASERAAFVQRVVAGCFDAYGEYRPEMFNAMMDIAALQMCTNLPVIVEKNRAETDGEEYVDIDATVRLYEALTEDINDTTKDAVCALNGMLRTIRLDCAQAVEWRKQRTLLRGLDSFAEVCDGLRALMTTLGEKADKFDPAKLAEYAGKLSSASEGLNGDNIIKFLADRAGESDNG